MPITEVSVFDVFNQRFDMEKARVLAELLAVRASNTGFTRSLKSPSDLSFPLLLREVKLGLFVVMQMGSVKVLLVLPNN